jgi:hypothetical protein
MIKIIDQTNEIKLKDLKAPFFMKFDDELDMVIKNDDGTYGFVNMETGEDLDFSYSSIEKLVQTHPTGRIVEAELIIKR